MQERPSLGSRWSALAPTKGNLVWACAGCVERFKAGGDTAVQLTALKGQRSWSRGTFVEKGGWAKMPDGAGPTGRAATLCAARLVALEAPPATAAPR